MTADEFEDKYMGKGPRKSELWYGEVKTMAPVGYEHWEESGELIALLGPFVKLHRLGRVGPELGFILAPDLVLAPDVSFVEAGRMPAPDRRKRFYVGPPSLAIEVVSPGDRHSRVARKVETYLEHGTPLVWVVDPDLKTVAVHRPGNDPHTYRIGDSLSSQDAGFAVEGFTLALAELFAE